MTTERSAAVVGVGQSQLYRHDDVPLGALAVDACRRAIEDAGLALDQIDGIAGVAHQPFEHEAPVFDGSNILTPQALLRGLGLQSVRWGANVDIMVGQSVVEAVNAVVAGACDYALVYRALHSPRGSYGLTAKSEISGPAQYRTPYGAFTPAIYGAIWHTYQDRFRSGTREQMATFVVQSRRNGLMWEQGYWTNAGAVGLTVDDYMSSRIISTPMCIHDCDIPVQGCTAFVITTAERAVDLPHPPAYVLGACAPYFPRQNSVVLNNHTLDWNMRCGETTRSTLWPRAGCVPADVDSANLYDGFSIMALMWLESLGFCGEGEAFDFIQGGRIAPDGELPVNTGGGSLGTGRVHGSNQIMESVLQVTGRAGLRQLRKADLVLATTGALLRGTALLFSSTLP